MYTHAQRDVLVSCLCPDPGGPAAERTESEIVEFWFWKAAGFVPEASWIAKHSGLGAEKAQDLLKAHCRLWAGGGGGGKIPTPEVELRLSSGSAEDLVGPASESEDDGRRPSWHRASQSQKAAGGAGRCGAAVSDAVSPRPHARGVSRNARTGPPALQPMSLTDSCRGHHVGNGAILLELASEDSEARRESGFQVDHRENQELADSIPASLRAVPLQNNDLREEPEVRARSSRIADPESHCVPNFTGAAIRARHESTL